MDDQRIITRDFVLAFLSQFVFFFAFSMLIPTLPIYLSRLGSREEAIGILMGVFSVSSLVFRPSVGKLLSRVPERQVMMAGAFLSGLTSIAYLFALPFWPFFIVRVLQGAGYALVSTAANTLIANIGPEGRRGQSLGYFFLSFNIPFALAPALGMFLINRFDFAVLFLSCTGLYIVAFILITGLSRKHDIQSDPSAFQGGSFYNRENIPPSMVSFFMHVIWGTVTTFLPLYALSHGVSNPGLIFSVVAFMLISGRIFAGRVLDLYRRESVILPCLVVYVIAMIILVFSRSLPMFILMAVIWGAGHALFYPALVALAIDRASSSRGALMAMFTAASDLGVGMGPVIMGIILQHSGYPFMFMCVAFTAMLNIFYFQFFVKMKKEDLG
jgi:MFS family permease